MNKKRTQSKKRAITLDQIAPFEQLAQPLSCIVLDVTPVIGCGAARVIGELWILSRRLGMPVGTTLDDIRVLAQPDDDPVMLYMQWKHTMEARPPTRSRIGGKAGVSR